MRFEDDDRQLMFVTFQPKVIQLCNDIRELQALGYDIPDQLSKYSKHATRFISYARHLQQIASFHNTVGDRMVPCQRPIMLNNAKELSLLVKSKSISWNNEDSVAQYISSLQSAVNKLSHDNNLLLGYHENTVRIVS